MSWLRSLLTSERRKAPRIQSPELVAYYWDGDAPKPHAVTDISPAGFYLETTNHWVMGTLVTMTLRRLGCNGDAVAEKDYIVVLAKVIRSDDRGVGFAILPQEIHVPEFAIKVKTAPAGKQAIRRFLDA